VLGDRFDAHTSRAWGDAYTLLATTMQEAAAEEMRQPVAV
jgi:hemoglobin-like flavoprotein